MGAADAIANDGIWTAAYGAAQPTIQRLHAATHAAAATIRRIRHAAAADAAHATHAGPVQPDDDGSQHGTGAFHVMVRGEFQW